MNKILVTGGLGFIGVNLIEHLLLNKNNFVYNIDKVSAVSNKNFFYNKNYKFLKLDISEKNKVFKFIKSYRPNKIFHLAAETHVDESIKKPEKFIHSNILGTFNLLESIRILKNKDLLSKYFIFVHVSTDEVYGSIKKGYFNENSPYKPNSPYSASKASSDLLVRAWNKTFSLPVITTNCSNNYGPYQNIEKLIPKVIFCALNNKPIPIYGNGNNQRDWIYVKDHVQALERISRYGKIGENYNIGSKKVLTNNFIVNKICKIIYKNKLTIYNPKKLIIYVEDRKGHDYRYAINNNKIYRQIRWQSKSIFEASLKKTIFWYYNNIVK
jgi:dTDP-glucose 4,6-dehydratase